MRVLESTTSRPTRPTRGALAIGLCLVATGSGGCGAPHSDSRDAGALDAPELHSIELHSVDALVTRDPSEWAQAFEAADDVSRAAVNAVGATESERTQLRSDDRLVREAAALILNVRLHPVLAQLHFSHGSRAAHTVAEILEGHGDVDAHADANLAFAGGRDHGILVPWVETDVCVGDERGALRTAGPQTARCHAFDTPCARGVLSANGCCGATLLAAGTACASDSVCDGEGACVPEGSVEAPRTWLTVFPDGVPASGLVSGAVPEVVGVLSPPPGLPDDSVELRAENTLVDSVTYDAEGNAVGVPGDEREPPALRVPDTLAIVAPGAAAVGPVLIVGSPTDAPNPYILYLGPPGLRALVLAPVDGLPIERVFVLTGELAARPAVLDDGTSAGALEVRCDELDDAPSIGGGAVRCHRDAHGRAVVVGEDLSFVWTSSADAPSADAPVDVLAGLPTSVLGGSTTHALGAGPGTCSPVACTMTGAAGHVCSGRRVCYGTHLGPCTVTTAESCNRVDDDCDGSIDENPAVICSDGVGCTTDTCVATTTGGVTVAGCRHTGVPTSCVTRATCETGVCTAAGTTWSTRAFAASDPLVAAGPGAPSGCSVRLGNSWCQNSFDGCVCNGPEICDPFFASGSVGCVSPPSTVTVGGTTVPVDPCDDDRLFCTVERVCCEPRDGHCRLDAQLAATTSGADVLAARDLACSFPGRSTRFFPGVATGGREWPTIVGNVVECSASSPAGSYPRCPNDGNPCTTPVTCSNSSGCSTSTLRPLGSGTSTPETVLGVAYPTCSGSPPELRGCATNMCDGAGSCRLLATGSSAANPRPPSFATAACTAQTNPILCSVPLCRTVSTGAFSVAYCDTFASPQDARCAFPTATCGPLTGPMCTLPSSGQPPEYPDLRFGCTPPPGRCYLSGPVNGTPDGTCIPDGQREAALGNASCQVCDSAVNPWGFSNAALGSTCTPLCDGLPCPCSTGSCGPDGRCLQTCHAEWPGCFETCTPF